jgi:aminomethyltransferase
VSSPRPTPLDALHRRLGARLVDFAGWSLPVHYPAGTLAEHRHTRAAASLFDVSHMGQFSLAEAATAALEHLVPADIANLKPGRQRYTLFLNEAGGVLDDLIVTRLPGRLFLVVNAARQNADLAHLATHGIAYTHHTDRALLALQGPRSAAILARLAPAAPALPFLGATECAFANITEAWISRSGYTGEDGFEISIPAETAEAVANRLLAEPGVAPAGLGARDTMRLEAGLCLHGNDLDTLTTPIEANLAWTIGKRRRETFDFLGGAVIRDQLATGPTRLRVGIRPDGKAPARAGTEIAALDGTHAGTITSGGFSPTLGAPIAMGYVRGDLAGGGANESHPLVLLVRGQRLTARIVPLPFVPHRTAR